MGGLPAARSTSVNRNINSVRLVAAGLKPSLARPAPKHALPRTICRYDQIPGISRSIQDFKREYHKVSKPPGVFSPELVSQPHNMVARLSPQEGEPGLEKDGVSS